MSMWHTKILPTLTLFTSVSTLLCCALPALLVSLEAGAVVIGLLGVFPQLIWLSEHKIGLFAVAGAMLAVSCFTAYRARNAPCPVDPLDAEACRNLRRMSLRILCASLLIYATGFFFAFLGQYVI